MNEQQLQKKIIDLLEQYGAWVIKTISVNKRGCPDILACLDGTFIGIEVKAPGKMSTVSPIQKVQIRRINEAGGIALATDKLEEIEDLINELLN